MAVEVLDEGIIKVPNPTGDVYILAATARGCAFGEDMTARWREVEACQRRDAVQGYMNTYAQLKPEPKNKFDPQAIEVLARGEFLGIAENRRVQGLGSRQREGIVELVAKLK